MGIDLHDDKGLVFGFRLEPAGQVTAIGLSGVNQSQPPEQALWLHFNLVDRRAVEWLRESVWLSPQARAALLSAEQHVRLESFGEGLVGVLSDLLAEDPDEFGVFHLYADQRCLITGRRHGVASLGALRRDLTSGTQVDGTPALLNALLRRLIGTLKGLAAAHEEAIDDAEDRVLGGQDGDPSLGQRRRAMARLRRQMVANRNALTDLGEHLPPWWDKPAAEQLDHLTSVLGSAIQDLELTQERARLLSEELDSRLTERTNRNLYFVSVAAALLLPITFISGIFGMNVGGLPWLEDTKGFIWVMGCMLIAVLIAFILIHRRRML